MPHFKFPNVTDASCTRIEVLLEQLLSGHPDPQKTNAILHHLLASHLCNIAEVVIDSFELQQGYAYDPAVVKDIRDELDQCR
jgi:regulator of RNase E activity RraB